MSTATSDDAQRVAADRVRNIANLIAVGAWKNRATVLALAERWQVAEEEVWRLHRVAAVRVKGSRGSPTAQRELSVAVVTKIRDDELASAAMYDEAAKEAWTKAASAPRDKMSFAPARAAKTLAGTARQTALAAEKYLAGITFQRPQPTQLINVSYTTNPDFEKAWKAIGRILNVLYGASTSDRLWEGIGVLEDRGEAGLEEWLAEQVGEAMMLNEQADGTFG